MSEWKQRRFWTSAEVVETDDGFTVELDGRQIKTPNRSQLLLPGRGLAEAIAAEWLEQDDVVKPHTMPMTRSANSAIDKVAPQRADVVDMLAAYGDSDLLCYRADRPDELIRRQQKAWDPPLDWAATRYGARLMPRTGVIHESQDATALAALRDAVDTMGVFQLTGFHDLVSLSGSLVLGLAAAEGWQEIEAIWGLSRLDENWQIEKWGADEEAIEAAEASRVNFLHAKAFFDLSGPRTGTHTP
ncbi:MAG: ATP12 family chaperone protein [Arenibacterium sp.]